MNKLELTFYHFPGLIRKKFNDPFRPMCDYSRIPKAVTGQLHLNALFFLYINID